MAGTARRRPRESLEALSSALSGGVAALASLAACSIVREARRGELLCEQGRPCAAIIVVSSGEVGCASSIPLAGGSAVRLPERDVFGATTTSKAEGKHAADDVWRGRISDVVTFPTAQLTRGAILGAGVDRTTAAGGVAALASLALGSGGNSRSSLSARRRSMDGSASVSSVSPRAGDGKSAGFLAGAGMASAADAAGKQLLALRRRKQARLALQRSASSTEGQQADGALRSSSTAGSGHHSALAVSHPTAARGRKGAHGLTPDSLRALLEARPVALQCGVRAVRPGDAATLDPGCPCAETATVASATATVVLLPKARLVRLAVEAEAAAGRLEQLERRVALLDGEARVAADVARAAAAADARDRTLPPALGALAAAASASLMCRLGRVEAAVSRVEGGAAGREARRRGPEGAMRLIPKGTGASGMGRGGRGGGGSLPTGTVGQGRNGPGPPGIGSAARAAGMPGQGREGSRGPGGQGEAATAAALGSGPEPPGWDSMLGASSRGTASVHPLSAARPRRADASSLLLLGAVAGAREAASSRPPPPQRPAFRSTPQAVPVPSREAHDAGRTGPPLGGAFATAQRRPTAGRWSAEAAGLAGALADEVPGAAGRPASAAGSSLRASDGAGREGEPVPPLQTDRLPGVGPVAADVGVTIGAGAGGGEGSADPAAGSGEAFAKVAGLHTDGSWALTGLDGSATGTMHPPPAASQSPRAWNASRPTVQLQAWTEEAAAEASVRPQTAPPSPSAAAASRRPPPPAAGGRLHGRAAPRPRSARPRSRPAALEVGPSRHVVLVSSRGLRLGPASPGSKRGAGSPTSAPRLLDREWRDQVASSPALSATMRAVSRTAAVRPFSAGGRQPGRETLSSGRGPVIAAAARTARDGEQRPGGEATATARKRTGGLVLSAATLPQALTGTLRGWETDDTAGSAARQGLAMPETRGQAGAGNTSRGRSAIRAHHLPGGRPVSASQAVLAQGTPGSAARADDAGEPAGPGDRGRGLSQQSVRALAASATQLARHRRDVRRSVTAPSARRAKQPVRAQEHVGPGGLAGRHAPPLPLPPPAGDAGRAKYPSDRPASASAPGRPGTSSARTGGGKARPSSATVRSSRPTRLQRAARLPAGPAPAGPEPSAPEQTERPPQRDAPSWETVEGVTAMPRSGVVVPSSTSDGRGPAPASSAAATAFGRDGRRPGESFAGYVTRRQTEARAVTSAWGTARHERASGVSSWNPASSRRTALPGGSSEKITSRRAAGTLRAPGALPLRAAAELARNLRAVAPRAVPGLPEAVAGAAGKAARLRGGTRPRSAASRFGRSIPEGGGRSGLTSASPLRAAGRPMSAMASSRRNTRQPADPTVVVAPAPLGGTQQLATGGDSGRRRLPLPSAAARAPSDGLASTTVPQHLRDARTARVSRAPRAELQHAPDASWSAARDQPASLGPAAFPALDILAPSPPPKGVHHGRAVRHPVRVPQGLPVRSPLRPRSAGPRGRRSNTTTPDEAALSAGFPAFAGLRVSGLEGRILKPPAPQLPVRTGGLGAPPALMGSAPTVPVLEALGEALDLQQPASPMPAAQDHPSGTVPPVVHMSSTLGSASLRGELLLNRSQA